MGTSPLPSGWSVYPVRYIAPLTFIPSAHTPRGSRLRFLGMVILLSRPQPKATALSPAGPVALVVFYSFLAGVGMQTAFGLNPYVRTLPFPLYLPSPLVLLDNSDCARWLEVEYGQSVQSHSKPREPLD